MMPKLSVDFVCKKCEGNIGGSGAGRKAETVREMTYLGDWVDSTGGGEAAVTEIKI